MKSQVKLLIDNYLNEWKKMGLNLFLSTEYSDMKAGANEFDMTWKAIESTVTDKELDELEKTIGYQLPHSFKDFLQYKHFIELNIGDVSFVSHPSSDWQEHLLNSIFNGYPTEYLIDKGIMPFANYSDWGHVCFDLKNLHDNESAVFLWDHEQPKDIELLYSGFESMIIELDKQINLL